MELRIRVTGDPVWKYHLKINNRNQKSHEQNPWLFLNIEMNSVMLFSPRSYLNVVQMTDTYKLLPPHQNQIPYR